MIKIDYEKCCWKDGKCITGCNCGEACTGCVEACPVQAITRKDKIEIDHSICLNCGVCINACKRGALSFE